MSLAAGWLRDDQYFMLVQLNDSRYKRDSISTVMRSCLIENLILSGVKAVNFVGGCSELLGHFCVPQICANYLFESKGPLSRVRDFVAPRLFRNSMVSRVIRGGSFAPVDLGSDALDRTVLDCWRSVLSVPNLNADSNFFDAAVPLTLAASLMSRISEKLSLKLPTGLLVGAPTPRRLAGRIREIGNAPIGCVVPIRTEGSQTPLYLVHDIHGEILFYRSLADCLAPGRPVFGVQAPSDLTTSKSCSIESLAAGYVKEILDRHTRGPVHLVGFSTGSVLAFEMARQFAGKGHEVGMLALIDGDIHGPAPALSKAQRYLKVAVRKACKIAFKFADELAVGPKEFTLKRLSYLGFLRTIKNLENASPGGELPTRTVEQALALAENGYRPQPHPGSALLIRFHDEAWTFGPDPLMGWSDLFQAGLETVDLPGGHVTGMGASKAPRLASLLASHMKSREAPLLNKLPYAAPVSTRR